MRHPSTPTSRVVSPGPALCLALLAFGLQACSLFGGGVLFGGSSTLTVVEISPEMNDNLPVAVDLIVVYTNAVGKDLLTKQASAWFAGREQYLRDHQGELRLFSWEWIPGQKVPGPQAFEYRTGALAAILFASYSSPGDHRARSTPNANLRISLGPTDFVLESP